MRYTHYLIAACIPLIQAAECRVACKQGGWDNGTVQGKWCACIDYRLYEKMTEHKMAVLAHGQKHLGAGVEPIHPPKAYPKELDFLNDNDSK